MESTPAMTFSWKRSLSCLDVERCCEEAELLGCRAPPQEGPVHMSRGGDSNLPGSNPRLGAKMNWLCLGSALSFATKGFI